MKKLNKIEYKMLDEYVEQVEIGDRTNREGHAAKVYLMLYSVLNLQELQKIL